MNVLTDLTIATEPVAVLTQKDHFFVATVV